MAITSGTPFEVVLQGSLLGQACYNVWFIQASDDPSAPRLPSSEPEITEAIQQWCDNYFDYLAADVGASLSASYKLPTWKARNLFDEVSLYNGTFGSGDTPGAGSGNVSPMNTVSLYSPTKRAHQNGGHKSMGGIVEGSVVDGILVSGTVTNWEAWLANAINGPFYAGVTLVWGVRWDVVNVKTIKVPGDAFHDRYYRLPVDATEYACYVADNWIVQPNMSTRNTRKYGRGS